MLSDMRFTRWMLSCYQQHALRSDDADAFQLLKQFSTDLRNDRELVMVTHKAFVPELGPNRCCRLY